jgi:hypothetical protein
VARWFVWWFTLDGGITGKHTSDTKALVSEVSAGTPKVAGKRGPRRMTVAARLMDEAAARTGLDDFGSLHVVEPLERWAADLDGPLLSEGGRAFLERLAVRNLCTRLEVTKALADHPEVLEVPLPQIVLIAGFARSGTTLLHNVMSCHPGTRALLRWELMRPLPPPEAATWATDPRIARVQASIEPLRGGALERMHWVNADEPEECPWGFYDCTGLLGRGCVGVMPQWRDYLVHRTMRSTFDEYRRLIQLLLWKNPPPAATVLVLKSPTTTSNLHAFAEAFPKAKYVFTHRDPYRVVVSSAAVMDAICNPLCVEGARPLAEDGRHDRQTLPLLDAAATAMERFTAAHAERIAHVHYRDLLADPVAATDAAFEALALPLPAGAPERIEAFLHRQRHGHRVAPPSSYDDYGYTFDDVWAEPALASYCSTFDVQPEPKRLVEPAPRTERRSRASAGA